MKSILLYSSEHGRTRKVVQEALRELAFKPDVFDVKDLHNAAILSEYDLLLIFTPTYGDEELQQDMENFLRGLEINLAGKSFAICELGNYYGYDDYSFGAMSITRRRLSELNGREFCTPLSLDSLPKVNWGQLSRWVGYINQTLKAHAGR